jgi:hypothetical protein
MTRAFCDVLLAAGQPGASKPCPREMLYTLIRRPNLPFQLTPLRVDKIVPILRVRISYNVFSIYQAAQLNGNPLGHSHPLWRCSDAA